MTVHLTSEHPRGASVARRVRRRAAAHLAALGRADSELSILLVGDGRIRSLNRSWRGEDRATDVLSFPISEPPGSGLLLGDVVISLDTAARRSRTEGRSLASELDRYLVHGVLHLLGHDHERAGDARVMAELEAALVRAEGLVGAELRGVRRDGRAGAAEERWTRSPKSISTPSRSGSTARGTRARTSRGGSRKRSRRATSACRG